MVIRPRIRGFICTTAHPVGCAAIVDEQIRWTRAQASLTNAPKNVLVVGGSAGYGLASRIVTAFGGGARTIGLSFEKEPAEDRTGSAGWYNNRAFDRAANDAGLYARSFSADAFSDATKTDMAEAIKNDLGGIDLLVYSLASPVRTDPDTGVLYRSAIKPVGKTVHIKSLNVEKGLVSEVELAPATDDEIASTVKVMGGEDWERWVAFLQQRGLLNAGFNTVAYTYIGSELTWPIYWEATLGKAKEDLDRAATAMRGRLAPVHGDARVAVLKAVVTQASSAIPVVPLYASILFRVMKDLDLHEDGIQHIHRLMRAHVYPASTASALDSVGRFRVDDWELRDDVQAEVKRRFSAVSTDNLLQLSDLAGFRRDFLRIFGFEADGVDYEADVPTL